MRLLLPLLFLLIITASSYSQAVKVLPEQFEAKVVKVLDGDTFDALYKDSIYRFRLFDIDAPEFGQEFYDESKQLLVHLTDTTPVIIHNKGKDHYGRTLGIVYQKNNVLNINREIVRNGLAWNYTHYSKDTVLIKLENLARKNQIGIWSSFHYLEPWQYRRNQ